MQPFNRGFSWRKSAVTLLLLATSTMLYADKPTKSYDIRGSASCAIEPATSEIIEGQTILFSSTTSGLNDKKKYEWEFESGTPKKSKAPTVSVTYENAGTFKVALAVASRRIDTSCKTTVTVTRADGNEPPTADANGPYTGTTNVAVSFSSAGSSDDGSIVAYEWDFGDGGTSTDANPTHTYTAAGDYTVSLTATDNDGDTASDSTTATISSVPNQAPTANANGPYTGTAETAVSFSSAGSSDPDGNIAGYSWSFGDGGTSADANPSHTYAAAGAYTVTLTVTDNDGDTASNSTTATISSVPNQAPTANANGPYTGTAETAVSFSSAGSSDPDGTVTGYLWDFGDGKTSADANPAHTYAAAGTYTVTLTVTDNDGDTASNSTTATISSVPNQAPTANANGPYTGTAETAVSFSSAGSSDPDGTVTGYLWDFGDGETSADANPAHTYAAAGTYTVTLTVTDNDGDTASNSTTATISDVPNKAPTASANGPYTGTTGAAVSFSSAGSNDSDGNIDSYLWAFGNGDTSTDANPTYTYAAAGTYTVSLTVTDNGGESVSDTTTATITVEPPPPTGGHADITVYEGPQTCLVCHKDEAEQMHGSVHYQQSGVTDFVTNIDGPAGERGQGEIGINTYCGTHENSPRFTCAGCHVGNGRFALPETDFLALTDPNAQESQLANIDCLTCHQEVYKRFPDGEYGFEDLVLENLQLDGNGKLVRKDCANGTPTKDCTVTRIGAQGIPIVSATTGDFLFEPADSEHPMIGATPLMDSRHDAARNVHKTTRQSCLNCHAKAGGGNGTKRGDFDISWANPTVQQDVHMSPDSNGENLRCADCHDAGGHRMFGRGLDLRPNDVPLDDPSAPAAGQQFSCESCHDATPHEERVTNTHAARVACQTCHIPSYAKGFLTEVNRDWEDPHPSDAACNGRGGWLPREDKETNLTPTYAWYDGTSEVYVLGETVTDNVPMKDGAYVLGAPNGDVASDGAKIHPMKEHTSKLALHDDQDVFIGHSTFEFFRTGSFDAAVKSGLSQTEGMSEGDDYTVTPVHTYQTLNHGVEPSDNALECGSCHGSTARMNLQGDLGYELKGNTRAVCSQCHEYKSSKGFEDNHDKHVDDKGKDCSVCHTFSRPERGLSTTIEYDD